MAASKYCSAPDLDARLLARHQGTLRTSSLDLASRSLDIDNNIIYVMFRSTLGQDSHDDVEDP